MDIVIRHKLKRFIELFTSTQYRHLLRQRLLTWIVRKLNPDIIYLGMKGQDEAMLLHSSDTAVTPYTLATGSFQKTDIRKICKILKAENKFLEGAFIDIGGNIGSTSIYAATENVFSRIYCFEPVPSNIRLAKANIALNNLEAKITLIGKAMSDRVGSLEMVLSNSNFGDHRISIDKNEEVKRAQASGNFTQKIQVETTTIDQFVKETPDLGEVSVIWSDTQGFEGLVLKGGLESIQENKIPLCIEFWPFGLRNAGCLDLLLEIVRNNYTTYYDLCVEDPKPQPIKDILETVKKYKTEYQHTDLFFV